MKQVWKKSIKTIMCGLLLCLITTILIPGIQCEAATKKPSCAKTQTVYLTRSDTAPGKYYLDYTDISSHIFIKNLSGSAKITSIKSSNKKITGSSMLSDPYIPSKSIILSGSNCKPGQTSKITFKVKQGGKTYSLSCKITLKLKPTNFTTFSIGGTNYATKLKGYSGTGKVANLKISPLKGTFKIKMKSGVKLMSVKLVRTSASGKTTTKTIKNGSKVTFKKGDVIQVAYKYTQKPANYNFTYKGSEITLPSLYTLQLGGITVINVA